MTKENVKPVMNEAAKEEAQVIKQRHKAGTVFCLEVPFDDEDPSKVARAWLRKPNLEELGAFSSLVQGNPIRATKILMESIWLEGDSAVKDDEECFLSAMGQLNEIIKIRTSKITKF
ncbi:hypothetical protein [Xanthovirga aplysinae]|uniref:hypothetical protein n=1 Tax=Xanthovirga aplysinae TaxID=2529853 RepID=UPI0012BD52D4|nr:hypothetical protein [Xanthovirga aplysinae]MTI33151.1 hypothetical protein [Xanthovirga aplysinae]